jgi:hypothetical protein
MARVPDSVDAHVLMLSPHDVGEDWWKSDLWRAAEAIPGVQVERDIDGGEARRFGVATSGTAVLYDVTGRLLFNGGITASRGHEGDNSGRDSIESLITRAHAQRSSTDVFGCPLFGAEPITPTAVRK